MHEITARRYNLTNLYDRANHFRRNNEFDKAMGIFEQILISGQRFLIDHSANSLSPVR